MSTILKQMMTFFALVAIVVIATAGAEAQDKDSRSDKKVLVTVTTIENGDTTFAVKELGAGKSGHTWVDSVDGNVFIISEDDAHGDHDGDVMFFSDEVDDGELTIISEGDEDEDGNVSLKLKGLSKKRITKLKAGKDGKEMNIFVKKLGSGHRGHGEHGDKECCKESSCCMMDKESMHMKMEMKDVDRKHNKMIWKEKHDEDDEDEEKDEDEGKDEDEEDGNNLL